MIDLVANPHKLMPLWLVYACAAIFNTPIVFAKVFNYPVCLVFLLAPLVAFATWRALTVRNMRKEAILFVFAGQSALLICLAMNFLSPDGMLLKHLLSAMLILFSLGFLFLGKMLACYRRQLMAAFSIASAMVLTITLLPNLFLLQPIWHAPNEYAELNVTFVGFALLGTFGVLSLAHLWCLQTVLCLAGFAESTSVHNRLLSLVGLASGTFLIMSTDSRASELCIVGFVAIILWFSIKTKKLLSFAAPAIVVIVIASLGAHHFNEAVSPYTGNGSYRLAKTFGALKVLAGKQPDADSRKHQMVLFTGRDELVYQSIRHIRENPLAGTAFRGKLEFEVPGRQGLVVSNTSTHVYYLTLLWKGGLLFAVPLFLLLVMQLPPLLRNLILLKRDPDFFTMMGIGMIFGALSLTWDILMVPSAGALAYFLLGLYTVENDA